MSATVSVSFWRYYRRVTKEADKEATWARDNLVTAALLASLVGLLAVFLFRQSPDWGAVIATCWVFGPLLLVYAVIIFWRGAWKLHQRQQKEIEQLADFKREIEDKEVKLVLARCNYKDDVSHGELAQGQDGQEVFVHKEKGESVTLTFRNPRISSLPGKIAESVLAKVKYTDASGKSFEQDGRWNQLDQPAKRSISQSTLDLLRITFEPGDERDLDIAAKFSDGLFAYNNDSQRSPGPKNPDKLLTGTSIYVAVTLIAQHVNQTFEFELKNPIRGAKLALVPMPQDRPVVRSVL